jgi:hypothetical protein
MTTIERFAKEYRLRITRDSCNDPIIAGRRGLYFDGPKLCLLILNGPVRTKSVLKAIGGKPWLGDKFAGEIHLYRGAPAVRCWSKYQQTDKGISLCAAPLRKDSAPALPRTYASLLPLLRRADAPPSVQPGGLWILHGNYHATQTRRHPGCQNHRHPGRERPACYPVSGRQAAEGLVGSATAKRLSPAAKPPV